MYEGKFALDYTYILYLFKSITVSFIIAHKRTMNKDISHFMFLL